MGENYMMPSEFRSTALDIIYRSRIGPSLGSYQVHEGSDDLIDVELDYCGVDVSFFNFGMSRTCMQWKYGTHQNHSRKDGRGRTVTFDENMFRESPKVSLYFKGYESISFNGHFVGYVFMEWHPATMFFSVNGVRRSLLEDWELRKGELTKKRGLIIQERKKERRGDPVPYSYWACIDFDDLKYLDKYIITCDLTHFGSLKI